MSLQTVLARVSGPDHPGVTAQLMAVLDAAGAEVQDVEQVVVRGRLHLDVVIAVPTGRDLLKELLLFGWEQRLAVDFEMVEPVPTPWRTRHAVTVLGAVITPADLGAVATAIAANGGNIDRIVRLSRYPVVSYELLVSGGRDDDIRRALVDTAAQRQVDVAFQREGMSRRAKRLIVMDVDSTLIQDEMIDLLAAEAGCEEEVAAVTAQAMAGEIDFEASLRRRVALLTGLDQDAVDRAVAAVRLTPGARTFVRTLRRLGYRIGIISGGFDVLTDRLRHDLDLDHAHANGLEWADGRLTGRVAGAVVDRAGKARLLAEIARADGVELGQAVAVGDGANDLDMLATAGLGIAFNAKPAVTEAADTAVSVPYLDAILFVLGVNRAEIEAADQADGITSPAPPT